MHMFISNKQKKKDKLWSACQTRFQQYKQDIDVMPSVPLQRLHPQRPLRPQYQQSSILDQQWDSPPLRHGQMKCSGKCGCSMSSMLENSGISDNNSSQQLIQPMNTPQCVCSNNCFAGVEDDASYPMEMESGSEEMSIEQDYETRTGGCYYESCGDNSTDCNEGGDYDHQYSSWLPPTATPLMAEGLIAGRLGGWQQPQPQISTTNNRSIAMTAGNVLRNCCCTGGDSISNESSVGNCHYQNQNYSPNNKIATTAVHSTVTSAISATAANVFRRCCRGGTQSTESSIGACPYPQDNRNYTLNNNHNAIGINNNNNSKNNYNFYEQKQTATNDSTGMLKVKDRFKVLMKKLKEPQLDTLCQVVENSINGGVPRRQHHHHRTHQSSACVLLSRETIGGEEPHVIACRLLFWPDLKTSTELKRIPVCPSGKEKVYDCCNPAHWNRILIPETAPPPYQQSEMYRLNSEDRAPSENSKGGGISTTVSSTTTGLRVQIPESFTTNGEDHSSPSLTWCQIAYWELAERVGERYGAKNSTINIYSEGSGGMCLKDLAEKKCTQTSSSVQKTRQKIGLGITLSQEADGVWLYNRSEAPIFVHSPTLNDDFRHVSKVPPGYCLNAFDKNRARTEKLVCPSQIAGAQTGPIDTFSMQISFAKGWGSTYRRPDITACHCWLEVLFSRR